MKKYLLFAVLLGAIAFTSVSYLAQAEPETGKVETVIEKAAAAAAETEVAPPVAAGSNGQEMDAEVYQNTVISCMTAKGYSAEDVRTPQPAPQTTDVAPESHAEEGMTHE